MMMVLGYYGSLGPALLIFLIVEILGAALLFTIFLVIYFLGSYVNWRLGKKFGIGSFAGFLCPVYGTMLLCDCVKVTRWLTVGFYLPWLFGGDALYGLAFYGVAISYMFLYGRIAKRLGRNPWIWGVTSVLFLGIPIVIMALDSSMPVDGPKAEKGCEDDQGPRYIEI